MQSVEDLVVALAAIAKDPDAVTKRVKEVEALDKRLASVKPKITSLDQLESMKREVSEYEQVLKEQYALKEKALRDKEVQLSEEVNREKRALAERYQADKDKLVDANAVLEQAELSKIATKKVLEEVVARREYLRTLENDLRAREEALTAKVQTMNMVFNNG